MNRFLVYCLPTRGVQRFETAREVATYMWGRDIRYYDIYILAEVVESDMSRLREALVDAEDKLYA